MTDEKYVEQWLKVSERKEIYYEHFGLMEKPEYCEKVLHKLQTFARNGIVLGQNLIATFESEDVPLDVHILEEMPHIGKPSTFKMWKTMLTNKNVGE